MYGTFKHKMMMVYSNMPLGYDDKNLCLVMLTLKFQIQENISWPQWLSDWFSPKKVNPKSEHRLSLVLTDSNLWSLEVPNPFEWWRKQRQLVLIKLYCNQSLEFFLNRAELSLNSANCENLANHWSLIGVNLRSYLLLVSC